MENTDKSRRPGENPEKARINTGGLNYTDKARIIGDAAEMMGQFVPIRWTPLRDEFDGLTRIIHAGPNSRARIEIRDNADFETAHRAAMHEAYHMKFLDRMASGQIDIAAECNEAVAVLDSIAPGVLDEYEALPGGLQNIGEEAVIWLAEYRAAGRPLPPLTPALDATLHDVVTPRPRRLAARVLALPAAFLAFAVVFNATAAHAQMLPAPPPTGQEMYTVQPGKTQRIAAFGLCRVVKNGGANPIMVPARSLDEWSMTFAAFTQNIDTMDKVTMTACPPRLDDACFVWAGGVGPSIVNDYAERKSMHSKSRVGENYQVKMGGMDIGAKTFGEGEYKDAYGSASKPGPLFLAANGTFDSIAVGRDTTVTFYAQKDFGGPVALKVTGPKLLLNRAYADLYGWRGDYWKGVWPSENWNSDPDPLVRQFVPATRAFINKLNFKVSSDGGSNMANSYPLHGLERGSMKVECAG